MHPMTAEIIASVQMARWGLRFFCVEHAEVFRHFLVLAHGVGHARSRVHAGERRADQRQEDGDCFDQHEGSPVPLAEQGIADHDHHVADRRRRARPHSPSCSRYLRSSMCAKYSNR